MKDMDVDSLCTDSDAERIDRKDINRMLYGRKGGNSRRGPNAFNADVMSEIADDREKDAIFNHSLSKGLFNDIRDSPLKERLPADLQFYNPALEKRIF